MNIRQSLLLMMGRGASWFLRDDFTDLRTVGAVNGTPAIPGPGVRHVVDDYNTTEMIANGSFESLGANPPLFTGWAMGGTGGSITVATSAGEFHSGSQACKATGAGTEASNEYVDQDITVVPGLIYNLYIWTRGDGTNQGRYGVYDVTHAGWLINRHSTLTGVTSTNYQQITAPFTPPSGCVAVRIYCQSPDANGGIAYFDDVSLLPSAQAISISSGKASFAYGVNLWTKPILYETPAITRVPGTTLTFKCNTATNSKSSRYGFLSAALAAVHMVNLAADGKLHIHNPTNITLTNTYLAATDYFVRIKLMEYGATYEISTDNITWTSIYAETSANTTPIYPGAGSYSEVCIIDDVKIVRGTRVSSFTDNFQRVDGALGLSPQGFAWNPQGTNLPIITSHQMTPTNNTGADARAYADFPATPNRMYGNIQLTGDNALDTGSAVFSCSSNASDRIFDQVHLTFGVTRSWLSKRVNNIWTDLAHFDYAAMTTGNTYNIGIRINGNTVTCEKPDGTEGSFTDTDFGPTSGRFCYYQIHLSTDKSIWPLWNTVGAAF